MILASTSMVLVVVFGRVQANDNLGILSKFMMNKPPGRRLVTAEINNSFVLCWHLLTISFYSSLLMRTFFGYLSYNTIFVFIEMIKISMFLSFAILNVSSFLQISLILNSRTIHIDDKEDKQKNRNMQSTMLFIFRQFTVFQP